MALGVEGCKGGSLFTRGPIRRFVQVIQGYYVVQGLDRGVI